MKKLVITFLSLVAVGIFSGWLYLINDEILAQFEETYNSFGMTLPAVTTLAISSLPFWKIISVVVAMFSLITVFANGKAQYLSIFIPIFVGVLYLIALYLPVLSHGAVV
jgi:hypothetical protein